MSPQSRNERTDQELSPRPPFALQRIQYQNPTALHPYSATNTNMDMHNSIKIVYNRCTAYGGP